MNKEKIVEERFDCISKEYDLSLLRRKNFLLKEEELISDYINKTSKTKIKILDAGCGTGTRAIKIKKKLKLNSELYGFDVSKNMVLIAKTKNYKQVIKGNMNKLHFKANYFDYVFCLFCVITYGCSFADRRKALENFHRNLKKDGVLFIDFLNRWHTGEGQLFKKSKLKIYTELLISIIHPKLSYGDILFRTKNDGEIVEGYFHSLTDTEFNKLIKGLFVIEKKYVIGYDTGKLKTKETEGNLLCICRKI